jgi:hypothetical protein
MKSISEMSRDELVECLREIEGSLRSSEKCNANLLFLHKVASEKLSAFQPKMEQFENRLMVAYGHQLARIAEAVGYPSTRNDYSDIVDNAVRIIEECGE